MIITVIMKQVNLDHEAYGETKRLVFSEETPDIKLLILSLEDEGWLETERIEV